VPGAVVGSGPDVHTCKLPGAAEVTQESGIDDPLPVMQGDERMSGQQARTELACACLFVRPPPTITYRSLQMDGGYAVFVKLAQFLARTISAAVSAVRRLIRET
jgi:hypothetical protein